MIHVHGKPIERTLSVKELVYTCFIELCKDEHYQDETAYVIGSYVLFSGNDRGATALLKRVISMEDCDTVYYDARNERRMHKQFEPSVSNADKRINKCNPVAKATDYKIKDGAQLEIPIIDFKTNFISSILDLVINHQKFDTIYSSYF